MQVFFLTPSCRCTHAHTPASFVSCAFGFSRLPSPLSLFAPLHPCLPPSSSSFLLHSVVFNFSLYLTLFFFSLCCGPRPPITYTYTYTLSRSVLSYLSFLHVWRLSHFSDVFIRFFFSLSAVLCPFAFDCFTLIVCRRVFTAIAYLLLTCHCSTPALTDPCCWSISPSTTCCHPFLLSCTFISWLCCVSSCVGHF